MKFTINREKFLAALNAVKDGIGNNGILITQNIKMETAGEGKLVLTTTDLDVVISAEVECTATVPGATTVPAKTFVAMVGAFTDPTVEFDDHDGDGKAVLSSGEATYRIATIPAKEFPKSAEVEGVKMTFKQSEFREMLRKVAYAASSDTTRRALMSVCLQGSATDGKVYAVCTDGRRLAEFATAKDGVADFEMLIPPATVRFLSKALDGDEDVDIVLAEGIAAKFSASAWNIQTKLVADRYPNWKMVVPKDLPHRIALERDRFAQCIRQASISASEVNSHIVLAFGGNSLTISARNEGRSDSRVMIPAKYDGDKIEVCMNPKFLLDILNATDEDEVSVNLTDGAHPITVTSQSEDAVAVVMPLRLF